MVVKKIKKNKTKRIEKIACGFLGMFLFSTFGVRVWQYHFPETTVSLKGEKLHLLLADTLARQYRGLGKRDTITPYDGMMFLFSNSAQYGFVMRDMNFPIDIVWFDKGMVADIAPKAPIEPGVSDKDLRIYYPRVQANMVLELPAGWASAHDLKIGDTFDDHKKG